MCVYHVILCDYICIYVAVAYPCPVYRFFGGYCVEDCTSFVPRVARDLPIVAVATILPQWQSKIAMNNLPFQWYLPGSQLYIQDEDPQKNS